MKVIVIGAGPMGLEAALAAVARGLDVTVLERGAVGESMRSWGATRLFSPMAMNLSARARALLGRDAPDGRELLLGAEMVERVLLPVAATLDVRPGHRVVSIGRVRMRRDELPGHPLRAERPFQLLVETPEGERRMEAQAVLDASGVYQQPLWLGAGGVPAPGERGLGARVIRDWGALLRRGSLAGRRVLLVGHGHSAAHAVELLLGMSAQVVWSVRGANTRPVAEVAGDPLPERARVVLRANALAAAPPAHLTVERRAHVESISPDGAALRVVLAGQREQVVDEVVALVGYRPDLSMLSELALEIAPATEGAGRLSRALLGVTDCLSVPRISAEDLDSGEPGFALVGAKSYGRSRTFLMSTGLAQIETILDYIKKQ